MRPAAVRRLSLMLMAGFALAAIGFTGVVGHHQGVSEPAAAQVAPATTPAVTAPDGAALYQRRCARCHDLPEMARALRKHLEDPRGWAVEFLAGHRHSTPAENGPIVDHLMAATADIEPSSDPDSEDEVEDDFSL